MNNIILLILLSERNMIRWGIFIGVMVLWLIIQLIVKAVQNHRTKKYFAEQDRINALKKQQEEQQQNVPTYQPKPQTQPQVNVQPTKSQAVSQPPQYKQAASTQQPPQYKQPAPQPPQYKQQPAQQPEMAYVRYHVVVNGRQMGPFDMQQLQQMAKSGQLTRDSHVWKKGMANWALVTEMPELASLFTSQPPVYKG